MTTNPPPSQALAALVTLVIIAVLAPVIAPEGFDDQSLTIGQSAQMKPLPGLADLPLGAPGNPNTSGVPDPPTYTSG